MNSKFVSKPSKLRSNQRLLHLMTLHVVFVFPKNAKQQRYVKIVQGVDPDIDNGGAVVSGRGCEKWRSVAESVYCLIRPPHAVDLST